MWLKIFLTSLILLEIVYLSLCFALFKWQNRLIFVPASIVEMTPGALDINYEEVWLAVEAGEEEKIHGWWLPNQASTNVLLYLHGNGANIGANLGIAKQYYDLGFSILMIDYRGYGLSKSKFPTEARVYKDAQVAWDYLVNERKISPENLFIYGHSLGGAIAIDLGLRKPQTAGLIIEGSFTSIQDMVSYYGGIYRLFPTRLIIHQRFDSLSKVPLLKMPLLFIHGEEDKVVPAYMSKALSKVAQAPARVQIIAEAGHNNVTAVQPELYKATVKDFICTARGLVNSQGS